MFDDLVEVMKFYQPGDTHWTDAWLRYLTHLDRERARSRDPIQHLLRRLDVTDCPVPLVFSIDRIDFRELARVSVRTSFKGQKMGREIHISDDELINYEDMVLDGLKGMVVSILTEVFEHSIRIKSRDEAEQEYLDELPKHIRKW